MMKVHLTKTTNKYTILIRLAFESNYNGILYLVLKMALLKNVFFEVQTFVHTATAHAGIWNIM